MGRPRKLPFAPAEDSPGWGLIRVAVASRVPIEHRRYDCANLREHEEAFLATYGGEQGRCPETCGGYLPEPATAAMQQFGELLGRRVGVR